MSICSIQKSKMQSLGRYDCPAIVERTMPIARSRWQNARTCAQPGRRLLCRETFDDS